MSYEFGLHLKQCEIVPQLTPPGTPQCNGVSEHHNRTLLDMVRSLMSLTYLPLLFWGYALETVASTLKRALSFCRLWWTCPMISKPLRINGSSRGRQTLIVVLLSTKLDVSQKVFDKFKELTKMRLSHP